MDFFGIGPLEFLLIAVLVLIVFGPGKIPEIARQAGRAVREFKKCSSALTKDFKEEFEKELKAEPAKPQATSSFNSSAAQKSDSVLITAESGKPQDASKN